ncbi:MAG: polyhydroxyalkanoate depolymerase [Alphaproteobacteria bacterium]|nr:polyhydroxyalkanoate depolymerase [Alphaproteobacteria bacterium]
MLYHLWHLHHTALGPMRLAAEAGQILLRHHYNPVAYSPPGRAVAAALELFESSVRPYDKPAWGLGHTTVGNEVVEVAQRVAVEKLFCRLLHFQRDLQAWQPRLLIVAPLSGHFATLLRGTVEALLPHLDIYITDWLDARQVPLSEGRFDLDDYIDYVIEFLRFLGPEVHVMAVCQPSVPVLAAAALMAQGGEADQPRSITLMGGPIDSRVNPTVPNKLAKSRSIEWFEHSAINRVPAPFPGFMRRVYPGFLQLSGFMQMNLDRHVGAHLRLYQHLIRGDDDSAAQHRNFYNEYRAVMDLSADYYLQTVERVFQRHELPLGQFRHRGRAVEPAAIERAGLFCIEGERDDISGVGQTRAALDLCQRIPADRRLYHLQETVGHYGVFNGRRWRENIAPKVLDFIRANA